MFNNFRENVKKILNKNKLTYSQLAEKSGLAENTIKCFMCSANNSRRIAERIADALNCKLVYSNGTYNILSDRKGVRKMSVLRLVDTKDKFSLEIDGTEIPYVTTYQITKSVSGFLIVDIHLSVNDVEELTIESDEAATVNEQKTKKT